MVMDSLVEVVRAGGRLGVVGVYVPQDPAASSTEAKDGRIGFNWGAAFGKGLSIGTGQCPVKRYNRELRDLIIRGLADPSKIVSTSSHSTRHPMPIRSLTNESTATPKSCCILRPDP